MSDFPHLTDDGEVHMVDVGAKPATERRAIAVCDVVMSTDTTRRLFSGELPKGDALASVRLAGIMGAKRTPDLIPLCHPILISGVKLDVSQTDQGAQITGTVTTTGQTGVEMEAMTAVTVAALALYDMVKGIERGVELSSVRLLHKSGGRSGEWNRPEV